MLLKTLSTLTRKRPVNMKALPFTGPLHNVLQVGGGDSVQEDSVKRFRTLVRLQVLKTLAYQMLILVQPGKKGDF
jgi:hypothetical protein